MLVALSRFSGPPLAADRTPGNRKQQMEQKWPRLSSAGDTRFLYFGANRGVWGTQLHETESGAGTVRNAMSLDRFRGMTAYLGA